MLELKDLSKTYGKVNALKDVSLTINAGESVAFLGPEGSGKSTVFKIATSLTPPSEGSVILNENDIADDAVIVRENIGFLPQTNPLYSEMLLYDYFRYVARLKGIPRKDIRGSIKVVCEATGLIDKLNVVIGTMTRTTKRLVGLAQTLLGEPDVLFIDAPYEGLEEEEVAPVQALIKSISKNRTLCLATESLVTATALCERLIIMHKGQVVADGSTAELLAKEAAVSRFVLVVKGAQPEEFSEVIKKLKGIQEAERITTRKPEMVGLEITAAAEPGIKQLLKDTVGQQEEWELIRIGRKTLDLPSIYERLTSA